MSVGARSHTAFFRPFKLIGLGFWQAWWMCAMCSPAVLPLDAAIVGLDARFAIQIATDVGYLAIIVASLSGKISNLRAMHGALPFAAGSFSLGTFMLMLAPYLTDASLSIVANVSACVCILFGNALLLLLWGELWSTLATGRVGRHLYLSYLFAFVLFFLAHLLPHPLDGLLVCTFPLASALIYATCMHEPRRTSNRRPIPLKSLPIASFLGMTVLVSIIYGASQHGIPSAYGFGEAVSLNPASMLVAGTCLAAFVLNLVITNPESEALQLFRNVIPVMAAGLALTLLLPPDYAFAGNGLIQNRNTRRSDIRGRDPFLAHRHASGNLCNHRAGRIRALERLDLALFPDRQPVSPRRRWNAHLQPGGSRKSLPMDARTRR